MQQTPVEDDQAISQVEAEQSETGAVEEEQVTLSAAEIEEEAKRCKAARKRSLKKCLASDLECRRSAMQRHKACLASLQSG